MIEFIGGIALGVLIVNGYAIKVCAEFKAKTTQACGMKLETYKIDFLNSLESDICGSLDKIIEERGGVKEYIRETYFK